MPISMHPGSLVQAVKAAEHAPKGVGKAAVLATFGLVFLGFGGCAQRPQQVAAPAGHGKEYFPSSLYGPASRRVIADGQPVPRGGGQYLVGKPYSVAGQTYYPSERKIVQTGYASWYGDAFHGRLTANGEVYDRDAFTAAHPTMPLPSYARVTNLRNRYSMIVRVNDRGPYASNRVMDVSRRVAEALDFKRYGTAPIKVEYVAPASLAGSDDAKLYATLRTDGPARWQGSEPRTMVAEEAPRARVASIEPYVPARPRPEPRIEERRPEAFAAYREGPVARPRDMAPWHRDVPPRRPAVLVSEEVAPKSTGRGKWLVEEPNAPRIARRGRSDEMSHPAPAVASRSRLDGEARRFAERELKHANDVEGFMRSSHASAARSASRERVEVAAIIPPSRPKSFSFEAEPTRHGVHGRSASLRVARSSE